MCFLQYCLQLSLQIQPCAESGLRLSMQYFMNARVWLQDQTVFMLQTARHIMAICVAPAEVTVHGRADCQLPNVFSWSGIRSRREACVVLSRGARNCDSIGQHGLGKATISAEYPSKQRQSLRMSLHTQAAWRDVIAWHHTKHS